MKIRNDIKISENGYAFDQACGESYSLNETAKEILQMMENGYDEKLIEENICRTWDVDPYELRSDMEDFYQQLKNYGLTDDEK